MRKLKLALVIGLLLITIGAQTAWAAPDQSGARVHIVRRGENLYRIALRYGTTVRAIAAANHIRNPNRIYAGQRLIIPGGGGGIHYGGKAIYVVRYGDTLSSIAFRHGVSVWALQRANGIRNANRIYAGQRLVIPYGAYHPPKHGFYYKVRRGDTLAGIACRHGVNMWSIVAANGICNPNRIYAGQVLWIP
jgi:LysM repeat protein